MNASPVRFVEMARHFPHGPGLGPVSEDRFTIVRRRRDRWAYSGHTHGLYSDELARDVGPVVSMSGKSARHLNETGGRGVHGSMNERATAATSVAGPAQAPASFEDFYFAERPRLFRALLLVTHNESEAEEIMQDTFCRMWERWDHLGGLADPTGYLYRSAMNAFRSRYRRAIRAAKRVVAQPGESDPFEEIAARDEAVRALLRLTPRQRAAVVVTKLLGYSADDAALILGIRPGTVRSLISQARRTLNDDEAKHG